MNTTKTLAIMAAAVAIAFTAVFSYLIWSSPEIAETENIVQDKDVFSFVKSMDGTISDGEIKQDSEVLIVDAALRRFFEYYLSATGEKSLSEIRLKIESELDRTLSRKAATEAKEILSRFIAFKQELVTLEKNSDMKGNTGNKPRQRFVQMQQLRSRFFSQQENQALFGSDDAYDLDALARLDISEDPRLSDTQKNNKFLALDAAMPAALRVEKEAPYKLIRLEENVVKMRLNGASEDDIYRMRAMDTTPEAAARLASLDREELDWKSRISAYVKQRESLQDASSEQDRLAAIQQIRDQLFSQAEQKRLPAYEAASFARAP
jgi:lipase chaperone LimK